MLIKLFLKLKKYKLFQHRQIYICTIIYKLMQLINFIDILHKYDIILNQSFNNHYILIKCVKHHVRYELIIILDHFSVQLIVISYFLFLIIPFLINAYLVIAYLVITHLISVKHFILKEVIITIHE
jgi:hypothetical protein